MKLESDVIKSLPQEPLIGFTILEQEYSSELVTTIIKDLQDYMKQYSLGMSEVSYSMFESATNIKVGNLLISRTYVDEYGKRKLVKSEESYITMKDHWIWADAHYFWIDFHEYESKLLFRIGLNFKFDFNWTVAFNVKFSEYLSTKYGRSFYLFFSDQGAEGYAAYENGVLLKKNSIGGNGSHKLTEFYSYYGYDINKILEVADANIDLHMAPYDLKEYIVLKNQMTNNGVDLNKINDTLKSRMYVDAQGDSYMLRQILDEMDSAADFIDYNIKILQDKMKQKINSELKFFKFKGV